MDLMLGIILLLPACCSIAVNVYAILLLICIQRDIQESLYCERFACLSHHYCVAKKAYVAIFLLKRSDNKRIHTILPTNTSQDNTVKIFRYFSSTLTLMIKMSVNSTVNYKMIFVVKK